MCPQLICITGFERLKDRHVEGKSDDGSSSMRTAHRMNDTLKTRRFLNLKIPPK